MNSASVRRQQSLYLYLLDWVRNNRMNDLSKWEGQTKMAGDLPWQDFVSCPCQGTALTRVHWAAWAVLPVAFSALYRMRGGFYYRSVVSTILLGIIAMYGVFASLTLPLFGKTHLINWSVARLYYHIAGFLLGVSVSVEGEEYLNRNSPAVFVCNHQSSMDVLFMASIFPKATSVVAKKAIKYYPFLGWYSK